mgnify:CR=1 FL=1
MNKKTRKALALLLGAVFLAGVGLMIRQALDYRRAEEAKQNALALVQAVRPMETGLPDETGWIEGIVFFDGENWQRMDPTFASSAEGDPAILDYIGNGSHYSAKYIY